MEPIHPIYAYQWVTRDHYRHGIVHVSTGNRIVTGPDPALSIQGLVIMRDARTAKYVVECTFTINEQNSYGDRLNTGIVTFTSECKANDLAELGQMMSRVQYAIQRKPVLEPPL